MDNEETNRLLADILGELQHQRTTLGNIVNKGTGNPTQQNPFGILPNRVAELGDAFKKLRDEAIGNYWNALDNLGSAAMSTAKQLTTLDPKFGNFGEALDSLGNAAMELGKNFGGWGVILGAAVKGITKVADAALKQTDAILTAKDSLTKLGGAGIGTGEELLKMAHSAGINSKNLDRLVKPMQSLTGHMQVLGTGVADAQKNFLAMTAVLPQQRAMFGRLGISQEELIQSQADYIKLQSRSGAFTQAQLRDTKALQQASLDYTKNLVELAAITGADLDKAKEAQEFAANEYNEQLRRQEENNKIAELEKKRNSANAADIDAQIKQIKDQQEKRLAMYSYLEQTVGKQNAAAAIEQMSTGLITQTSVRLSAAMPDFYDKMQAAMEAPTVKEARLMTAGVVDALREQRMRYLKEFRPIAGIAGEDFQKFMLLDKESNEAFGKIQNQNLQEAINNAVTGVTTQMQAGADPMADARETLRETQIKLAVGLDKLLLTVNPMRTEFGKAAAAAAALASALGIAAQALAGLNALGGLKDIMDAIKGGGRGVRGGKGRGGRGVLGDLTRGRGVAGYARGVLSRAPMGLAAGLVGEGLQYAGDQVGGKTGKAISGVGTVAQFAGAGFAVGGPWGALAGGVAGLGKAIYDNVKASDAAKEALFNSDDFKKQMEKREQDRQDRLKEQNEKLKEALQGNADALGKVTTGLEYMGNDQFNKLIDSLRTQNGLTDSQIAELRAIRTQAQETRREQEAPKPGEADQARRKEEDEKITGLTKELERLQAIYNEAAKEKRGVGAWTAKGRGIQEALDALTAQMKPLKDELKAMTDARKAEDETVETQSRVMGWQDYFARKAGFTSFGAGTGSEPKGPEDVTRSDTAGLGGTADENDLLQQGLKLKPSSNRDVQAPDAKLNPKLIDLAKRIQNEIPGFNYFSGFNDRFHQRSSPNSRHTQGNAVDFTLATPPDRKEGAAIVKALQDMGFHYAQDEYNNASDKATGGHIHAQIQAEKGGIVDGPKSGYPATLHGKEVIVPLAQNSVLEKLAKASIADMKPKDKMFDDTKLKSSLYEKISKNVPTTVKSGSRAPVDNLPRLDDLVSKIGKTIKDAVDAKATPVQTAAPAPSDSKQLVESIVAGDIKLMETLSNKLDKIANILESTQGVQEKTLRAIRL